MTSLFFHFQSRFDALWRKYNTYSGGEQLFGLTVTEYPELARTKKELGLLQKLYGLYNAVIDGVNGYYDILWTEVDIEKINNELLDFQNRYCVKKNCCYILIYLISLCWGQALEVNVLQLWYQFDLQQNFVSIGSQGSSSFNVPGRKSYLRLSFFCARSC